MEAGQIQKLAAHPQRSTFSDFPSQFDKRMDSESSTEQHKGRVIWTGTLGMPVLDTVKVIPTHTHMHTPQTCHINMLHVSMVWISLRNLTKFRTNAVATPMLYI